LVAPQGFADTVPETKKYHSMISSKSKREVVFENTNVNWSGSGAVKHLLSNLLEGKQNFGAIARFKKFLKKWARS
jgi:hypothetical protein